MKAIMLPGPSPIEKYKMKKRNGLIWLFIHDFILFVLKI